MHGEEAYPKMSWSSLLLSLPIQHSPEKTVAQ